MKEKPIEMKGHKMRKNQKFQAIDPVNNQVWDISSKDVDIINYSKKVIFENDEEQWIARSDANPFAIRSIDNDRWVIEYHNKVDDRKNHSNDYSEVEAKYRIIMIAIQADFFKSN